MNERYVLSIRQPWAWAIIHAGKNIENRTWSTTYRGEIYIHASKSIPADQSLFECKTICDRIGIAMPKIFEFGKIVGRCNLVDCRPYENLPDDLKLWAEPGYCFIVEQPELIAPVEYRGALGIHRWRSDITRQRVSVYGKGTY